MISISARAGRMPIREQVRGLTYEPWVGRDFENSPIKPYLLGDSHYDSEDTFGSDITHGVVLDHGIREQNNLRFMTDCVHLLTGLPKCYVDLERFWHSIAFSNLSTTQATWSREAASGDGYQTGARLFPDILSLVQPDFVVTFGDRVWNALEASGALVNAQQTDGFWRAEITGTKVFHSTHPSGGFSWPRWSKFLSQFLKTSGYTSDQIESFVKQVAARPRSELLHAFAD